MNISVPEMRESPISDYCDVQGWASQGQETASVSIEITAIDPWTASHPKAVSVLTDHGAIWNHGGIADRPAVHTPAGWTFVKGVEYYQGVPVAPAS